MPKGDKTSKRKLLILPLLVPFQEQFVSCPPQLDTVLAASAMLSKGSMIGERCISLNGPRRVSGL